MDSYSKLINYFNTISNDHKDVKTFLVGNSERILGLERSVLKYPVLWMEDPDIRINEMDGAMVLVWNCSFVVLVNNQIDGWQQENFNLEFTFQIIKDIVQRLIEDSAQNNLFVFDPGRIQISRIHTLTADNDFGWRADFELKESVSSCIKPARWKSLCPVGAIAQFTWDNSNEGDFTALTIANTSLPVGHGWTWLWTWIIDSGAEQTSTDENPTISGSGKWIYIKLEITDGNGCSLCASIHFGCGANCGSSVPYLLKS